MSDAREPEVNLILFLTCLNASKFVLLRVFSLMETICLNICSKPSFKSAKSPLPVDVRATKWSLLSSHLSTTLVPQKWEILCNAPSTENPWKLLITTNALELIYMYPVILIAGIIGKANRSLGFIRKILSKCPENVKQQAYLALVRPQLEYMDGPVRMGSAHSCKNR